MTKSTTLSLLLFLCPAMLWAQSAAQRLSTYGISPANYSGITPIGHGDYAVVSDKEVEDGFYVWAITQDSITGVITNVTNQGFRGQAADSTDTQGISLRDAEGIAFVPYRNTLFISSEGDQEIREWNLDGSTTGTRLAVPDEFKKIKGNYGFEALGYDSVQHLFYTTTENMLPIDGAPSREGCDSTLLLRMQAFNDSLMPTHQYAYLMDAPKSQTQARTFVHGVVAITPLGDGRIAVLEREAHITQDYNKSKVWNKLYITHPADSAIITFDTPTQEAREKALAKQLVTEWSTQFKLFNDTFANYEGMCLGQPTSDGKQTLLLVSDSQGGFGIGPFRLKDWIKVIVLDNQN